jgi:predicted DNA-binding protein (UPF0278 family)
MNDRTVHPVLREWLDEVIVPALVREYVTGMQERAEKMLETNEKAVAKSAGKKKQKRRVRK